MKFPRYWAKGTIEVSDQGGKTHPFTCWGWSDESTAVAEKIGKERASRLAEQILKGNRPDHYLYGDRPLREEILETFNDRQGNLAAAVTRNSYGCHILNTANIMFVDVDLPQPTFLENLKYSLQRLLGKFTPTPAQQHETAALARLESMIRDDSSLGVHVYRTRAGLRYLFTHGLVDPKSDQVLQMMKALQADPLYVTLCQTQVSFRARLTPKPWRCGIAAPTVRWPWLNVEAEARFRQWESKYEISAQQYATCKFIGVYGNSKIHPAISAIVELHERRTKTTQEMNLA